MAVVLSACPPSSGALVFRLPDGTTAKDATFDFGARGAQTTRTFALVNTSEVEVAIADAVLEGPFAASVAATSLLPGAELPVSISWTPAAEDTGTLRVTSAKAEALASLTLSGRFEGSLCALPDVVDFGGPEMAEPGEIGVLGLGVGDDGADEGGEVFAVLSHAPNLMCLRIHRNMDKPLQNMLM
jgi:hypothetical protein